MKGNKQQTIKTRQMLETECRIKEIDGKFYQDKVRAGLKELTTFIQSTTHKYGKPITYQYITFYNYHSKKTLLMTYHRFLYTWYNDSIPAGYDVDHIDNNPLNNDINNLQLLTRKENLAKRGKGINQYSAAREKGIEVPSRKGITRASYTHTEEFLEKQLAKQKAKEELKIRKQKEREEHKKVREQQRIDEFQAKQTAKFKERIADLELKLKEVQNKEYKYESAKIHTIEKINHELEVLYRMKGDN